MDYSESFIISIYVFTLVVLSIFGVHRYLMVYLYYRYRHRSPGELPFDSTQAPRVTVQLPIYNEYYVAERLIDAVAELDYPRDRFEVQVLDDSTDETQGVARRAVERHREAGLNIHYIHRTNREGFKAGALDAGLKSATGDFVAIFDADFIPPKDILTRAMPHFAKPEIGLVQMRWEHLNRDSSLLTRVQSVMLDGHFVIEHTARNCSGRFFNFNGTAGIWRCQAIKDAGGWEHDTLTEDMDLSYRAQMAGWKFLYLPHVAAPGEVPIEINAFKSQQHRWTKGAIQVARKLMGPIWRSNIPLKNKIEASFHLANNFSYLLMLVLSLIMWPAMKIRAEYGIFGLWWDVPLLFAATFSVWAFYGCAQIELRKGGWRNIMYLPALMALGIGLTLNNAKAVLEGLSKQTGEFVRTAKFRDDGLGAKVDWRRFRYNASSSIMPVLELAMGLYFSMLVGQAWLEEEYAALPFLLLFQAGYLYVALLSFLQRPLAALLSRKNAPAAL